MNGQGAAAADTRLAALAAAVPDRRRRGGGRGRHRGSRHRGGRGRGGRGRLLGEVSRRLDAQAAAIAALGGGSRRCRAAVPPALDDFRESVGLTLAEFLARIETGAALH